MEVTSIDVKNVCRCCILPSNDLEPIFESFYENDLPKILSCITSGKIEPKIDDDLSILICQNCKLTAINAYKFQQMCIESDRSLRILIGNCEVEDPAIDNEQILMIEKQEPNEVCTEVILEQSKPVEEDEGSEIEAVVTEEANESENDDPADGQHELFECTLCIKSKYFTTEQKLENHVSKCHQQLSNKEETDMAIQEEDLEEDESNDEDYDNGNQSEYSCSQCSKTFKKASLLTRHKKLVHETGKKTTHECTKCNKRFSSSSTFKRHDILHSDLVEKSKLARHESQEFICIICGRSFKTPDCLASHLKVHKSKCEEDQEYSCKLCHDIFPSFSEIIRHAKNHIENATHQCTICNKLLALNDDIIDHFLRHKEMKPHVCPVCQKSFIKLHKLNVHLRTHSEEKPYLCPECGKSLSTNENLKRHLIRHTGIKPYSCTMCPSRFVFKSGLTSHMSTHSGLKPFVCATCGSSFTKSSSLTKHHRIHTGERPYVCEVCGMRFNSSDHVKRHLRTHTGERPYKCQYCDRSYAQSNDLLKHTRIHVGENTYKCNHCNAAFRLQAQLREHYRIHYDGNTLRNSDTNLDQKPQILTEIDMIVDQEKMGQQLQYVQQYQGIIKNEKDDLYEDLSKKQKLQQK
ncbi:hypothetical protein PVAND_002710 [Polypedilum vanderplanki]|uniref:Zinc finger protein n=1 Tax=Polypedilum vanderplanki TaxID=319348 RepID=A0A9J6BS77_POLVA|nr:hypothetical protein PVAND_002710 [Polypedilum vanderplanki]